jgi:POT family proton-dependent oligopeptide transporter
VFLSGIALLALFAYLIAKGGKSERSGLIAMLVLTAQTVLFFIFYQQMSTSLTLFALHNVTLDFYGWFTIPPEQFQVLNPFWIAVLSPVLAILYARLGRTGSDPSVAGKYAWGFGLLAMGFFIYAISGRYAVAGLVSPWWMVWGYLLQSLGELLISGLGLAMVARYVGPSLRGVMMGAWLLATGISQYLGSAVANYASVPSNVTDPVQTLPLYTHLFWVLGWVAIAGTAGAIAMLPLMRRLDIGHSAGDGAIGPEHETADLP